MTQGPGFKKEISLILGTALLASIITLLAQIFPARDAYEASRHFLASLNREKFAMEPRMISERRELSLQTLGELAQSQDILTGINGLRSGRGAKPLARSQFLEKFQWTEVPSSNVLRLSCLAGETAECLQNLDDWSEVFMQRALAITSSPLSRALAELESMIPQASRREEETAALLRDFSSQDSSPMAPEYLNKGVTMLWNLREYSLMAAAVGNQFGLATQTLRDTLKPEIDETLAHLEKTRENFLRHSLRAKRLSAQWERASETLQALVRKTSELKLEIGSLPPPVTPLDSSSCRSARSFMRIVMNALGTFMVVLIAGLLLRVAWNQRPNSF